MKHIHLSTLISVLFAICIISCSESKTQSLLNHAESIMEEHPDSALSILSRIDRDSIFRKRELAHYSLLMSMALDKNYIDTTTFDVLQPAIDYYLDKEKGTPNDRLRTHYYQGRIYQNMGDDSHAMTSFIRATNVEEVTDNLTLARTHVAICVLCLNCYAPEEMTWHALCAANLYESIGKVDLKMDCLSRALDGSLLSDNKLQSDSIMKLSESLINEKHLHYSKDWNSDKLSYALKYGNKQDIRDNLDNLLEMGDLPDWINLEVARSYLNLGEIDLAEKYINSIDSSSNIFNNDKYLIIKSEIQEAHCEYDEALKTFKKFYEIEGKRILTGESYDLAFVNEQYVKDLSVLKIKQRTNYTIWGIISCAIILIAILITLIYRHKLLKTRMELLQSEKKQIESEKEKTENEKRCQVLASENQKMKIAELQDEIVSLKEMLTQKNTMSISVENAVKERIRMLNSLIATAISSNPKYSSAYDEWKEKIIQDHESFMNSTRLAFKASHPSVIEHLEQHGLTEAEINYACLYALGLNGKEIGKYIHSQRHYHTSSDIRKKLGLDINNTNLGNYIRKLME